MIYACLLSSTFLVGENFSSINFQFSERKGKKFFWLEFHIFENFFSVMQHMFDALSTYVGGKNLVEAHILYSQFIRSGDIFLKRSPNYFNICFSFIETIHYAPHFSPRCLTQIISTPFKRFESLKLKTLHNANTVTVKIKILKMHKNLYVEY